LVLAEDVNFCPVITEWPHRKAAQLLTDEIWGPDAPAVVKVDPHHFLTLRNAEDERGGGAWIFLCLPRLLSGLDTAGGWTPSGLDFIRQALDLRRSSSLPWVDGENTEWWEVPVALALDPPDSMEVLGNHFMQYGLDDVTDWGRPPGKHEANDRWSWLQYTLGLYYHYLNLGFRLPPSAGSASGAHPNPVGYNRVYAYLDGPFTVEKWFAALRQGRAFITNGPMLFFHVHSQGGLATARVDVQAREPLDRIELVANGEVVQWAPAPPGTLTYHADFTFDPTPYTWVAARCFLRTAETFRLAHSSPVFLRGHRDCRPDAQYFIDWVNDLIGATKARKFASPSDQEHLLYLYGQGLAFYQQKLRQGCSASP
jgi:hypothetical protein